MSRLRLILAAAAYWIAAGLVIGGWAMSRLNDAYAGVIHAVSSDEAGAIAAEQFRDDILSAAPWALTGFVALAAIVWLTKLRAARKTAP